MTTENNITINFYKKSDNTTISIQAQEGDNLMDLVEAYNADHYDNEIELHFPCGGSLSCSGCHIHIDLEHFEKLEPKTDDEEDTLEIADDLNELSRCGCQITNITKDIHDQMTISLVE